MAPMPTLVKPPPADPNKSRIENLLEVTELAVLGPNIFTNTRQPWHPPGARGIFGGAVIAMCLAAGQRTVPQRDFVVHSCHCYFLLAGAADLPILFHVELVRDGKSFATRTVQARQRGRCIFTTTISFVKEGSGGRPGNTVEHAAPMPLRTPGGEPLVPPADGFEDEAAILSNGPFQNYRIEVVNKNSPHVHEKKTRQWVRARDKITGGRDAHLTALAYMSDSYFIGTISRIHRLWRFPFPPTSVASLPPEQREHVAALNDFEGGGALQEMEGRPAIGMMVSLDHSIYFHQPGRVRADEWMLSEMDSPWAGDGRGVVTQRIFAADGTLLASCFQEGVVRLKDEEPDNGDGKAKL